MSDLHADNRTASRAGCARVTRVQDPDDPGTIVAPADPGPATPPGYRCWPPDPVALRRLCSLVTARVNTSPGRDLWPISRVKRLCRKASVGRAPRVRPVPGIGVSRLSRLSSGRRDSCALDSIPPAAMSASVSAGLNRWPR